MYLTKRNALLGSLLLLAMAIGGVAIARSRTHADPVTVPERTSIHVTLDQALASNQSRPGDHFDATVADPIAVGDKVVIPQGARVEGVVVDARESGRLRGRARLQLALQTIEVDGKQYEIRTPQETELRLDWRRRRRWSPDRRAGSGWEGRPDRWPHRRRSRDRGCLLHRQERHSSPCRDSADI